ncbi:serine hydrolase [Laspinema palackyanum]|uniref:serine hydrolase n=1 Tax=Laspinema palackyanum TaxID=3231601 RepID=UPI00345D76F9
MENLQSILESIQPTYKLPALAVALVTSEGMSAIAAVGDRKYGSGIPLTVGDRFHLGSCTKVITATLMGILLETGTTLQWQTTLQKLHSPPSVDKANVDRSSYASHIPQVK